MHAARSAATLFGTVLVGMWGFGAATTAVAVPDTDQVLLADVGTGFTLVSETPDASGPGSLARQFEHENALLNLTMIPVTTPPGVRDVFGLFSAEGDGFETLPEPSLDLAGWLVFPGSQLGESGDATLVFASRDHVFIFALFTDAPAGIDAPAFVRALAERQVEAAGGPPAPIDTSRDRSRDDELVALLPVGPPPEYGLTTAATLTGSDELPVEDEIRSEVIDFLNKNSVTATRLWSDDAGELLAAVSVTRYPYDIFAAAFLGIVIESDDNDIRSTDALRDVPDVAAYTDTGQIGTAFRRGDYFVLVLTDRTDSIPEARAAALATDLTRLTADNLPSGGTDSYVFPDAPSKLAGIALTAAIVTAAAGGSAIVARVRARRIRRRWAGGTLPAPAAVDGPVRGAAIALDRDAKRLRRNGALVAGGQISAVNVGIVALAGDFAPGGYVVAALALVAGLVATNWWQRRELGLLGSKAPPRGFVIPRPFGALVGVLALAVLGFGVGFALKGFRYLIFPIDLAQLKWSDLLGVAPRTVGILFTIGGFVVAAIGGGLFRLARALGRRVTKQVLAADHRQSALYLRSFDDDSLPLPSIASARRPLFELFSVRGADPFEESVAWELNSYGPVVAVGRPGRRLASLGAAREHLPDETWRDQVAARMEEAGIIAVATGETDGLAWELGQVVSGGHLAKTFFVFPPVAPDALDRRWAHTTASLADHGLAVGPLPVPPSLIHTVRLASDGTASVTYATRRDEATYRTAVDHALDPEPSDGSTAAEPAGLEATLPSPAPATGTPA
ncbi:MAG TPA: hypothetical protein VNO51_09125 [Ilumatobacteraceae bacterium]|nr:hypothetical protein [Ilumatobacteraceae bacterium]